MSKRLNRDDIDKFHDHNLYIPTRTIYLGSTQFDENGEGGVDALSAQYFIKNMTILNSSSGPIHIILNNPGGEWAHGMAIYDIIKLSPNHVTITVYGQAMSMASVILQAADSRVLAPNCEVMIHYGSNSFTGNSKDFDKWSEANKRSNTLMEDILLEKIQEKHPTFKLKQLQSMLMVDTIIPAKDAVNLGLADEILTQTQDSGE